MFVVRARFESSLRMIMKTSTDSLCQEENFEFIFQIWVAEKVELSQVIDIVK